MFDRKFLTLTGTALAAILMAGPALAQKSKDEIRLTIIDPFDKLDSYHFPANEPGQYTRAMYGKLLIYDEHAQKLKPELAKSWKQINPTTWEFELRDDVNFTSGNKFTAEDVKYLLEYIRDPKLKIRFKGRYRWPKNIEILSPTKIRITSAKPKPDFLMTLAYRYYIYDKAIHEKLENKALYGSKSASTTGAYKMISISANKGVHIRRNDAAVKMFPHLRAPIKNVKGIPIPDEQTQVAALLTGQVHVIRLSSQDQVLNLSKNPDLQISPFSTRFLSYITLDAAGRSKNKIFQDSRVRQAFFKAIDREMLLNTFMPAGKTAVRPNTVCFDENIACSYTTKPVGYDPAGAKRLLAEAGYANGFDLEFSVFAPLRQIAEAIAGELRKVGIRATVRAMPLPVYTKRRGRGELTALLARYPTFAQPNTANLMNFFFGSNRDYSKDPVIQSARKAGLGEMDLKKRTAIYQKAMDQVNKMSYIYPFGEQPNVYVHAKSVEIKKGLFSSTETRPTDYFWK